MHETVAPPAFYFHHYFHRTPPVGEVPCRQLRALEGCFGNVIAAGHTINPDAIKGKEIFYSTDNLGIFEGFSDVADAPAEIEDAYESEGGAA